MENLINWIEIPVSNINRATSFYQSILGVEIQQAEVYGSKMGFFPSDGNQVSGALVEGEDYQPSTSGVLAYLNGGSDLQKVLDKVDQSGGKTLVPKTLISDEMGYFGIFIDSEGNRMAVHSLT